MQATPQREAPRGPGILPGASTWSAVACTILAIGCAILTASCTQAIPLQSLETPRGTIQYTLHTPATPARHHVILAHGFLRSPQTMHHLAAAFASEGIATACIQLKRSSPFHGNHAENARDIIALRQALDWKSATYAGFSAGGLSALLAASDDPKCMNLLLCDPVDSETLGTVTAPNIHIPVLAILGKPGPGNAHRNANTMLNAIQGIRILEIPEATHCDFEARPSKVCHLVTSSKPDSKRTATVHESIIEESLQFLNRGERASRPIVFDSAADEAPMLHENFPVSVANENACSVKPAGSASDTTKAPSAHWLAEGNLRPTMPMPGESGAPRVPSVMAVIDTPLQAFRWPKFFPLVSNSPRFILLSLTPLEP
jgi:predicted alpha/beta-hydrolase family hydrolase